MGVHGHKRAAPESVTAGVLTVSTSRGLAEDKSGHWMVKQLRKEGHDVVFHDVVTDEAAAIVDALTAAIHTHGLRAVVVSGGTGVAPADVTIEAVKPLFEKELTAFSTLFAMLSFEEIDSAALMSRATAGVVNRAVVFCIPGSLNACKLACRQLIFPELTHLAKHLVDG